MTWNTENTWTKGPRYPVQQTKHALVYLPDGNYHRDGALWGDAPPTRTNPTTQQTPLDGRRLTDLFSASSRWLHNPTAGRASGGRGTERHGPRTSAAHAKPTPWLRCLIANTSDSTVLDPFTGTGSALRAAKDLGRHAIGIDVDADALDQAVDRLAQEVLPL